MDVVLISIGDCPSLALRNVAAYCRTDAEVRDRVRFHIHDLDLRRLDGVTTRPPQQWSWVTPFDTILAELLRQPPQLLGLSCSLWNVELTLRLAAFVKQLLPEVTIVLGGPEAGPRARQLLERNAQVDLVVAGDGEIPFLALLRRHLRGAAHDLSTVPSLWYRDDNGIQHTAESLQPLELSSLRQVWADRPDRAAVSRWSWPYLLYETQRGCPYSCSYCVHSGSRVNNKDPDLVVAELNALLADGHAVEIVDPTFTSNRTRARQILHGIARPRTGGWLYVEAHPDSVDAEMAGLLARAGVSWVGMGLQTISEAGLAAAGRRHDLAAVARAARALEAEGVHHYVDVIYGLPGTSRHDFVATIDALVGAGCTQITVYRLLGLAGSPMMADAQRHGLVFNPQPPYELLQSATMSLEDVIFCERFTRAFQGLLAGSPHRELTRKARTAGGISSMVMHEMAD